MATLIITCECTTLLKLLPLLFTTNSNTFCWFKKKVSSIDGKHLLILWLESNSVCLTVCVCVCVCVCGCVCGLCMCALSVGRGVFRGVRLFAWCALSWCAVVWC